MFIRIATGKNMLSSTMRPATWGVGTKITAFTFALVGAILGVLIWMISHTTASMLEQRNAESVQHDLAGVRSMVEMFHLAVASEANTFSRLLAADYPGAFALDTTAMVDVAGKSVPTLTNGGKPVNLDFTIAVHHPHRRQRYRFCRFR
jgi:methyl-accepting chemotaxis protein